MATNPKGLSLVGMLALALALSGACVRQASDSAAYSVADVDAIFYSTYEQDPVLHSKIQNEIAVCMASMGFEYRPEPFPEAAAVSETPFVDSRFESIRSGNEPSHLDQMLQEFAFGDEDAYYVALRGRNQFSLGETLNTTPRAEEYGCELHAAYEIVGVEGYRSIDNMGLLLGDLSQEASADPRVVDARAAYDGCLAESEYSSIGEQIDRETGQATLQSPIVFWDEMRELEMTMNAIDERCAEATKVWVVQDEVRERLWREKYQEKGAVFAAEVERVAERNRNE